MSDCLIIIPTYNEKENIEKIIRKIFSLHKAFHILVVEDNSPDGTADIVKRLIKEDFFDRLFIEEREKKLGLGTAYIHGFKWMLQYTNYQFAIEMDADFSHNPDDLIHLYNECANNSADVCIGSRYVNGVNVVNWPMKRILISYFASKYVQFITRMDIKDTTAGFVCWTRKVLETIQLDKTQSIGYAFQIEMKYTASRLGFNVKEYPIIFTGRLKGTSKMSQGIFEEAVLGVIKLRFKKIVPNNRL